MKKDIETVDDIKTLVNNFYTKVVPDETIGWIFEDIVNTDWALHLPIMYKFWEAIILSSCKFNGNPIYRHVEIDRLTNLLPEHFEQWKLLFFETVDEFFEGKNANTAKYRAETIANLMENKVNASRI